MQQTVLRGGPRDLIAFAWYAIGFRPRESLVLVGLRGARRRCGIVVRVDLPPAEHRAEALDACLRMLRRGSGRELVALVVSDVDGGPRPGPGGSPVLPHRDLDRWLRRELPRRGFTVFDVLAVGPESFRPYGCPDPSCCPAGGIPLAQVSDSVLAAHMVLSGRMVLDRESELVADVRPVPGRCLSRASLDRAQPVDLPAQLRLWRELLASAAPQVPGAAVMLAGLRDVRLRDAVMFTLVPGSGLSAERLVGGEWIAPDEAVWAHRPDRELVDRGRVLLAGLARVAPVGDRAEALAVLAWLGWWCNDAARGRLLVDLALADRPGHRLAGLVGQLLAAGVPPTWAPRAAAG